MARWALISGEDGTEKTAYALRLVESLRAAGFRAEGFVQRKHVEDDDRKHYELVRIRTGEAVLLGAYGLATPGPKAALSCSLTFCAGAFETAASWMEEDAPGADLLVVDSVGKQEVRGVGHAAALVSALRWPDKIVLLCARAHQLFYLVEKLGLREEDLVSAFEFPAEEAAFGLFTRDVLEACRAQRGSASAKGLSA